MWRYEVGPAGYCRRIAAVSGSTRQEVMSAEVIARKCGKNLFAPYGSATRARLDFRDHHTWTAKCPCREGDRNGQALRPS